MASHVPSSAVPIAGSSHAINTTSSGGPPPHGASATSTTTSAASPGSAGARSDNNATSGTPTRLSRGNSFRIPLPPNSPNVAVGGAISPSSPPGTAHISSSFSSQLGTSYGSTSTGSRLGNFALGFRRNRGASTNRGDLTSPVASAAPPSPPPPAFPSLQASTSLTDFGAQSPYFDGGAAATGSGENVQAPSPSAGHNPSTSISSSTSTTRGYFTRRGFGRKNTGGLLSGNRTPTSEQSPSLSAMQRSRSSSQPSLPLSVANPQQGASANAPATMQQQQPVPAQPASANAATMVFSGTSQPVALSNSQMSSSLHTSTVNPRNGGSSSTDSSRRPSGEAPRAPATATLPNSSSSAMQGRSASQAQTASNSAPPTATSAPSNTNAAPAPSASTSTSSETQHIRLVPHLESTRSLHFDPVSRDILPTIPLRIGRFTDRNPNQPISALDQNRVAFKSKVVSRTHAEIWFEPTSSSTTNQNSNGNGWFIRDLKSSSGTFLNHIRLSGAGMESRPFPIRDGDVLQLGVDYQGGTEEIYRCVKMRIELNRGWQRGANSFNTNALRQIRALGNVGEQASSTTTGEASHKKKKKHSKKHKKKKSSSAQKKQGTEEDANMDDHEGGDDGTASDDMQVDKKEKEKKNHAPPSGVTDCCICLFSVTVYQALFIAPCSHIFHFKCIRPLVMQHYPGFSCPLCRTFGDLEADVEQDDVPEPVQEEDSSSSSSGESESEEEDEHAEGVNDAPALPDKDVPAAASVNAPSLDPASTSENTAVLHSNAISLTSSDPNLDTLRPGRKSPLVPSVSEFGASSSANAQDVGRTSTSSNRPSLDVVRPPSGTRTPPSRGSRVASFQSAPPSGAAVAAALEGHVTPHSQHHHHHQHQHHSHHHSGGGDGSWNPPSAGDFDPDIRRGSIYVHGADGHAMHIPITGRSRPGSVHEGDISSDAHHQQQHHHHQHGQGNTQSPSVSAAEKNKARSVRSMRMTKSKNSTNSLRSAAAGSASVASPSGGASSVSAPVHRRRASAPSSSDEEDVNMDEEPLAARPMPGGVSAPGVYPFPDAARQDASGRHAGEDAHMGNDEEEEQDNTPPSSHQEDSESASDVAISKGKGKEIRSPSNSTTRDAGLQQSQHNHANSSKQGRDDAITASVHAIV